MNKNQIKYIINFINFLSSISNDKRLVLDTSYFIKVDNTIQFFIHYDHINMNNKALIEHYLQTKPTKVLFFYVNYTNTNNVPKIYFNCINVSQFLRQNKIKSFLQK